MVWHGEYWMRSFSVWPKDANVCSLLEVLEPCVARKYFFERESLSWNHQSSRQKRQALAEEAQGCVGEADHDSGRLTPGETQSRRVYPTSGVYPTCPREKSQGKIRKAFSPSSVMILPVLSPHDTIVPPALTVEQTSSLTTGIKYSFARRRKPAATGNSSNRTM